MAWGSKGRKGVKGTYFTLHQTEKEGPVANGRGLSRKTSKMSRPSGVMFIYIGHPQEKAW